MLNKCELIGRLGQEVELRYTAGGSAVANFSLATSEKWKDKQTGEQQEKTQWHRCSSFGKLAEIMGQYLHKGSLIYAGGRIEYGQYTDKEGIDRHTTSIIVTEMKMLDGKGQQNDSAKPVADSERQNFADQSNTVGNDFDDDVLF